MYNIAQSANASDSQSLITDSFCSADYSKEEKSSAKSAEIRASYGLFSGSASGSVSDASITERQTTLCKAYRADSSYRSSASSYTKSIHQGSLDAFNTCQQIAASNTGMKFELIPDSTMQGVAVILSAPIGNTATLMGIEQIGSGHSICKTQLPARNASSAGKQIIVDSNTTVSVAGNKVTFTCNRELVGDGKGGLYADAQTLVFITTAGDYPVAMAPIGTLSRVSAAQVQSDVLAAVNSTIAANATAIAANTKQLGVHEGWLNNHDKWLYGINDKLAAEDTAISANKAALGTKLDSKSSLFAISAGDDCGKYGGTFAANIRGGDGRGETYLCNRN